MSYVSVLDLITDSYKLKKNRKATKMCTVEKNDSEVIAIGQCAVSLGKNSRVFFDLRKKEKNKTTKQSQNLRASFLNMEHLNVVQSSLYFFSSM